MRIIIILIALLPFLSKAEDFRIAASSEPIANIIRLVTNKATIEILTPTDSCPHEYILKPSDFRRAENSDFVIYISDVFEPFIKPIIKHSKAKIVNLSHILNIPQDHNMHIWMSLEKVRKATHEIANILKISDKKALQQIDKLIDYKKTQLSNLKSVLILSDSLEYLFDDMPDVHVKKLYVKHGMASLKDIKSLINHSADKCIIINAKENAESISLKIKHNVIGIASENWSVEGYKKTIDAIRDGCHATK